jgi:hypothetical protein
MFKRSALVALAAGVLSVSLSPVATASPLDRLTGPTAGSGSYAAATGGAKAAPVVSHRGQSRCVLRVTVKHTVKASCRPVKG